MDYIPDNFLFATFYLVFYGPPIIFGLCLLFANSDDG